MKSSEVLELVRAGFSKDEIAAMDSAAAPAKDADPEPDAGSEPDTEPDAQPAADEIPAAAVNNNTDLMELTKLKAQIEEQTKELKQLKSKLIEDNINKGVSTTASTKDSVYDMWAERLNN